MQCFNAFVVESVNFMALLTVRSNLDVVRDFIALVVIAEFDKYFCSANSTKKYFVDDIIKADKQYKSFLIIQRTSSNGAKWLLDNEGKAINKLEPQPCEEEFVDEKSIQRKNLKELIRLRKEAK